MKHIVLQTDPSILSEPPLTPAERKVVKSYGGWTNFMNSFALKPWDDDDAAEGKAIVEAFASNDEQEDQEEQSASVSKEMAGGAQPKSNAK